MERDKYFVLDSKSIPLARAVMESSIDKTGGRIVVLDEAADRVAMHKVIQLISMGDEDVEWIARITRRQGDSFSVESIRKLRDYMRRNLRIGVSFHTFLYPISGKWKGRYPVQGINLSCGGVAFICKNQLEVREKAEIVIPFCDTPLLLPLEVLREDCSDKVGYLYATKFLDLTDEEEAMVREMVFSIQLKGRNRQTTKKCD